MNYTILTNGANKTIKTIFDSVKKGKDPNGKGIDTWGVTTTDKDEEVLIHTADQWAEIGNLHLIPNEDNKSIQIVFRYWSNWTKEHEKGDEERYILGRFTELLLVHFAAQYNNITINK